MATSRFSPDEIRAMRARYVHGEMLATIAADYGLGRKSIAALLRQLGVPIRKTHWVAKPVTPEIVSSVLDRYERGQSHKYISFALDLDRRQVRRILAEHGRKTRPRKMLRQCPRRPRRRT